MYYWIVFKFINGKRLYISNTDEFGYPNHTEDEEKAWKFKNFDTAKIYFNLGYTIQKC